MAEIAKGIIDIEINTGSASSELKLLLAQINAFQLALNKGNADQAAFSAKFSKALQQAINQTGSFTAETIRLQTAAATLDKTLTKGKISLGQFFSAKYNKNSAIAAETMALASERARRLQTQFIATSAAANGFQDALAVRPLAAFSTEAAIAGQKAQIMSSMFKQGTTQLINFGKNVQWAGRQLMVGFTVPLTIFGAVAGKTFMELEKQVVGFKKVYGDLFTTPAELNQNLEAVKGLAAEYTKYGIAVKDTIGLAAQAAAAGRQGTELTDSVTQATRLATLGQMDQNAALETTISLQSAFRLSGQDLADTINFLNMVENQTVVSLQDISAAIPRVAPVIQGLGGDVKDLTVFLAAMQEGGVDAAEGANALKSGLASLINPTKQATAMLSGMGINLQSIIEANKGDLMGTVQSFAQALATLDQFSRQQALEQVFGKFQYAKLGALFENISREGSQAQQVIATLGYSTEQLAATADKELKTIEESFGVQLTGAIERFKLAIAPIGEIFVKLAIPLVNLATKIAEAFNGLSDGQKKFAAIGAVIVGIVVPAVTMLTGLFLNLIGTLAKMGQGISLFGMGLIKGGPLGAIKAVTQSAKYLSLAEMDAAMAAQQLIGPTQALNTTLINQAMAGNTAAASIGNLTKAYAAMIATQAGATRSFPGVFGTAGAAGVSAKTSQVVVRGLQRRNSGGPIFMSDGTTVPGMGNTDTVPAMLTPGEFVVNKEATKNNLGLLHSINDSKSPQGLNSGGKAKGMQYFAKNNRQRVVKKALDELFNMRGGFGGLTFKQVLGQSSKRMSIPGNFKVRGLSGRNSQVESSVLPISSPQELAEAFAGREKSRLLETFGISVGILPARLNKLLSSGTNGANAQDVKKFIEIAGDDFLEPFRKAYVDSNGPGILDTSKITGSLIEKLGNLKPGEKINDNTFRRLLDQSIGDSEKLAHVVKMRTDSSNTGMGRITGVAKNTRKRAESLGIEVPVNEKGKVTASAASNALIRALEDDLSINLGRPVTVTKQLDANRNPVVQATKPVYEVKDRVTGESLLRFKSGDTFSLNSVPAYSESKSYSSYRSTQQEENITSRIQEALKSKDITQEQYDLFTEQGFNLSHMNSGGQVPGYNAGALIGKSLRRRVRPGKEERLAQQSALHNFAFDSRNVRGTPEMDTILGMMNPLTQKTRATRGTVLGSTRNKELPYAQQKKIVSAIKEGRYEDLFGMKLNFKGGAGSYTTKRDLDFSPFIGDLSNPTLKDFSYGFMGLDTQKKDISKLRKIMKTPKIKKLTPGTAEYARELAMAGWSPARSFRPGPNPTIGSDWTFEQVLANKTREYNNAKKRLNKTFPDKKIQQLFIDEMVGSGVLALDVQKASYKHPVMSDRNNRVKRLRAKEHELLVGNRTSEITGVASDLRTKLPSLITKSGAQGYNKGGMIPGTQYLNAGSQVLKLLQNQKQFGFMSNPSNPFTFESAFLTGAKGDNPVGTWARTLGTPKDSKATLEYLFSNDETKSTVLPMIGAMLVNARSKGASGLSPSANLSADSSSLVKKLQDRGILGREYSSEITNAFDKADAGSQVAKAVRSVTGSMDAGVSTGNYHALLPKDIDTFGEIARMLLRSKGKENISQEEATMIMNEIIKRGTLDDFLKSEAGFKNLLLNSGNIVPGMGNTDTVPAMLTPGEFVVNKEATKNNLGLLHQINGSQAMNNGGVAGGVQYFAEKNKQRVVQYFSPKTSKGADGSPGQKGGTAVKRAGLAGSAGSIVGGVGGFMLAEKMGIDSMAGQFAVSIAAGIAAQKALAGATLLLTRSTKAAGAKDALYPVLSRLGPRALKMAGPITGATLAFTALGFAAYALSKKIKDAEKSGAKFSKAMYGSSETIKQIGDVFGRESFAATARRASAEKVIGKNSEEAAAESSKFMQGDVGKKLLEDIKLVKEEGGIAMDALTNQLSSGILAGVLTQEEAKAIATDIGVALNDRTIAITVSGQLNKLMGPDGKDLLKNVSSITAKISPEFDASVLRQQAQKALEDKVGSNGIGGIISSFFVNEKDFTRNFMLQSISERNLQAYTNESQARELLNLAYQEGAITLEELIKKQKELLEVSKNQQAESDKARAAALGYNTMQEAAAAGKQTFNAGRGLQMSSDPAALKAINEQKDLVKKMFEEELEYSDKATNKMMLDLQKLSKVDMGIYTDLLNGTVDPINIPILTRLSGDLDQEGIDKLEEKLLILENMPNIDKVIDFQMDGVEEVNAAYDLYLEVEKADSVEKRISILYEQSGLEMTKDQYNQFSGLPDVQQKMFVVEYVTRKTELNAKISVEVDEKGGKASLARIGILNKKVQSLFSEVLGPIADTVSTTDKIGDSATGDKAKKEEDKLKKLKDMLMERFKLQEMLIDKEAEGSNNRIKQLNREIELEQREVSLRQKALEDLAKKENAVNDAYNLRVDALDKVSESNSRIGEQERSRIGLASALASGDIAAAASISSEMQQQSAQYQIEDAKAALEKQRQVDLDALTVSINGKLVTRKGIESEIEKIQGGIYDKGIEIQGIQDTLIGFEQRKLDIAKEREKVETRMYLIAQRQAILDLTKNKKKLTKEDQAALASYTSSFNSVREMYNTANPGEKVDKLNYGGSVARMANGGIAYKGSTEPPPALRMGTAGSVPGIGMTDKVNALLTPGEFVIRKSVADKNRGFLESLNSQVFPGMGRKESVPTNNFLDGIGSPRYSIPEQNVGNIPVNNVSSQSSNMYNNTYSVNVNVSGTNASPDDIANVVMAKLSNQNRGNLRSSRY